MVTTYNPINGFKPINSYGMCHHGRFRLFSGVVMECNPINVPYIDLLGIESENVDSFTRRAKKC